MSVTLLALAMVMQQPKDTLVLKPVIVTATRVPVTADLVPASVTVLRGVDLASQGIRSVADALELVPAAHIVETGSYGGQTSLFVRGGESDYVKVLLDGVPLNQAGGGIDLANLTTDNVDRIEIVRGPVSVLYGSDAMTGVVQIFTRRGAATSPRVGAELRGGTYGTGEGAFDVSGGTQKVTYTARGSLFSSTGLYSYNNDYRNTVLSAALHANPDARTEATVTYRYGDDSYHFPTNGQGAPVDSNQRSAERGPLLSVSVTRSLSASLSATASASLKESRAFFNDEPDSPGEDGTFWSRDYLRRSGAGGLVTWRAHDKVSLMGGVEYEDERQSGTSEFSASFGTFPDSIAVQRNTTGFFTQATLIVGRGVMTAGGRRDDNSQFGSHGTYRVGLVYSLAANTRIRASAGTGFKEPTFFENFAHGFTLGNPDLDPERSQSWELGIERDGMAVTYFDQRFRDLIEYNPAPPPGTPNYFNVGSALATGVEVSLHRRLTQSVEVAVAYTYLHTRVLESGSSSDPDGLFVPGKPLIRRPAQTLAPQVTARPNSRTRVTLGARWVGKRDDLDFNQPVGQRRVSQDPYTRVNVSAEYTLHRLVLLGSAENLFNDQSQEIPGYRPRGRTVLLGLRVVLN
ncbi:MAG TPA: TonB-dependent receptor [Gemmatimonadales bacterium]